MKWLWEIFSIDDDPDYDARQEAYNRLESGQIALESVQEKVEQIANKTEEFKRSNEVNHYRQRLVASYRGK